MSILTPAEMRYGSISAFGLIIMTAILKWSGVGNTRYTPMKPDTANATALASRSAFETFMDPSITSSSPFVKVIDLVLTPFQLLVDMVVMWGNVWDAMGWGSIFIIVPMLIMFLILAGIVVKMMEAVLP